MALEITHVIGAVACGYHRVAEIVVSNETAEAYAVVHSFKSAEDVLAAPLHRRTYRFTWRTSDAVADAYADIRALPEWAGAVEVPG